MITIGVLVGSLRRRAISKAIAEFMMTLMPGDFQLELVEIGHLPLFNQDYDDDVRTPEVYTEFREKIEDCDGFLFVTPEHNRSYPAALKNALDIASRPPGHSVWNGKPGAIVSVSPGSIGAFGANHHLRQVMTFLNIFMLQQPEAYIGNAGYILDADGHVADEDTKEFLQAIADAFVAWVRQFVK